MNKEPSCRSPQLSVTHLAKILACYDHTLTQTPNLILTPSISITLILA